MKPKEPFIPQQRYGTIRQQIIALLEGQILSAKDLSAAIRISEKEVYEHLEHIQRTSQNKAQPLLVVPAQCKQCGFVFRKRERLKKPGKCPVCRSQNIEEPLFSIEMPLCG